MHGCIFQVYSPPKVWMKQKVLFHKSNHYSNQGDYPYLGIGMPQGPQKNPNSPLFDCYPIFSQEIPSRLFSAFGNWNVSVEEQKCASGVLWITFQTWFSMESEIQLIFSVLQIDCCKWALYFICSLTISIWSYWSYNYC